MAKAPFKLRSGNSPPFKSIGTGDSPYTDVDTDVNTTGDTGNGDKGGKGGWKKALMIGVSALTSGLDAVYGRGKILPMSASLQKKKSNEKTQSIEDRLAELENLGGTSKKEKKA